MGEEGRRRRRRRRLRDLKQEPNTEAVGKKKPQAALKPPYLEKESSHLEVSHFCVLFHAYVMDGYNGVPDGNPINMHLIPLVEPTWHMSLVQRSVKDDKTLDEVIAMILEESNSRNLLHARRMQMLRIKKSGSHRDFLT